MQVFNLPENGKERIVIVGAGFAGLKLARSLAGSKYQVVLIDKNNFHQFQPLFYQVATSGIEPASISFPVRKIFQKHANLHFRNTALKQINVSTKQIDTTDGPLPYDYLVLATGVGNNYFGSASLEKHGLPMKSTAEAIYVRNRILESFEKAILTQDNAEQASLMSVVIVGGGPTGVELSGAIAEMKNNVLFKDYPELDFSLMQIQLYEAGPRLLNGMSEKAGADALKYLHRLGVQVFLNEKIENFDGETVSLGSGTVVSCRNLLWTAGVRGFTLPGLPESIYARGNRIKVDAFNQVEDAPRVFAIGDMAFQTEQNYTDGHPQVAQVAIQQAKNLAKNLKTGKWKAFSYRDKGSLATIGRNMAVADLPAVRLSGFVAWLLWLFVHLMSIVGVKNRVFIFINWAQSYLLRDQSLRVMIKPFRKQE
ncbi:MAG: NAD(P)/FAD-dependent oxidoreductase [Salinivirgaceae bacterium]